jgi:membrane-associated phospholipid phosphatase
MKYSSKKGISDDSYPKSIINSLPNWVRNHHITRSAAIAINLIIFLAILPPFIRNALFRGIIAQPFLTGMLLLFSLLALSLLWTTGQLIDASIFLYFNFRGARPLWLDLIMLGFTQFGTGVMGMLLAVVLFLLDDHRLAYEIILGTLTLWLMVEIIKALIRRSRPFSKLTQARIVGPQARGCSFPSGHTSQSFFIAVLLIQHFKLGLGIAAFLYSLALLVGITRMYVGAHYPRDVLAGAILGSVWGVLGGMMDAYFFTGI